MAEQADPLPEGGERLKPQFPSQFRLSDKYDAEQVCIVHLKIGQEPDLLKCLDIRYEVRFIYYKNGSFSCSVTVKPWYMASR